jgi:hypothetical protein
MIFMTFPNYNFSLSHAVIFITESSDKTIEQQIATLSVYQSILGIRQSPHSAIFPGKDYYRHTVKNTPCWTSCSQQTLHCTESDGTITLNELSLGVFCLLTFISEKPGR